jgi:hypothetical protein
VSLIVVRDDDDKTCCVSAKQCFLRRSNSSAAAPIARFSSEPRSWALVYLGFALPWIWRCGGRGNETAARAMASRIGNALRLRASPVSGLLKAPTRITDLAEAWAVAKTAHPSSSIERPLQNGSMQGVCGTLEGRSNHMGRTPF